MLSDLSCSMSGTPLKRQNPSKNPSKQHVPGFLCPGFPKIGDFLRGGIGRGGNPHPGERYNVFPQWCRDTRTVTRVRHHLLC